MKRVIVGMVAAAALAACGQSSAPGGASAPQNPLDSVFPNLFQTAYRVEAVTRRPNSDETMPLVMIRDGQKLRMEFAGPQGQSVVISNAEAGEAFVINSMGGRQMAVRIALDEVNRQDVLQQWTGERTPVQVGPCTGAGQIGTEWSLPPTEAEPKARSACVTGDGIILKATEDGATTWEATSVSRGPQDPTLFQPPADVSVMDLGGVNAQMRAAMEKMKAARGQ